MTKKEQFELIEAQKVIIMGAELELKAEDYKVVKCAEAKIKDAEMPYDVAELFARRDGYRKAINDAQAEIERLEAIEPEPDEEEPEDIVEPFEAEV